MLILIRILKLMLMLMPFLTAEAHTTAQAHAHACVKAVFKAQVRDPLGAHAKAHLFSLQEY